MAGCNDKGKRCRDLERICRRVREKATSYERYNFSPQFNDFLKAFYDLAQEYDLIEDFYRICVAVPLEMTGLDGALYLYEEKKDTLSLVCDSRRGLVSPREPVKYPLCLAQEPYEVEDSYFIPVYSKPPDPAKPPESQEQKNSPRQTHLWQGPVGRGGRHRLLGMYAVRPLSALAEKDKFFFLKYANRIGYNLHNRIIAIQNIDHLKFINSLVMDIEHNVIVPNMYFKYLFKQLKKKIVELDGLERDIHRIAANPSSGGGDCQTCLRHCDGLRQDLLGYHGELVKHHANISLFLESLFRREHFEQGHLVLHPKRCCLFTEVILPQLEHYAGRLERAGVQVLHPEPDNLDYSVLVDIGLLAQVYANLFSNGAKYARESMDQQGHVRKAIAYGRELIDDFPVVGKKGIKFNVFSTGPHIPEAEREQLFQEGVRGSGTDGIDGTGHGLSFVRHVIELHGGRVGYEPTPGGNNFYFILPLPMAEIPENSGSASC